MRTIIRAISRQELINLGLAKIRSLLREIDSWIRRRLRCTRLKQRKRRWSVDHVLVETILGVTERLAWKLAVLSKGWWRLSRNPISNMVLPNKWFKGQGLFCLSAEHDQLKI